MRRDEALRDGLCIYPHPTYSESMKELIHRIFDDHEQDLAIATSNSGLVDVTRVEVIGKEGREFSKWVKGCKYKICIQDDGRTIKLFEEKDNDK